MQNQYNSFLQSNSVISGSDSMPSNSKSDVEEESKVEKSSQSSDKNSAEFVSI